MSKKKADAPAPMDPGAVETTTPVAATNRERDCYAIQRLRSEVEALFPEAEDASETGGYDGRNTALDITFDLSVLDTADAEMLSSLLGLIRSDERVADVVEDDGAVLVEMKSNPRTQDSRAPFGLDEAYTVLVEDEVCS